MQTKTYFILFIMLSLAFTGLTSCGLDNDSVDTIQEPTKPVAANLKCDAQIEQTDYTFFKMTLDGRRVGDLMPMYDEASNKFFIYYLKDIWNDVTHQRHPWYAFTTDDFSSFENISSEIIGSSSQGCEQDYAIGTGSVIKKNNTYYGFYTGHNPNFPSGCVDKKEGIMLATSTNPNSRFTKNPSFSTIYAPKGLQFDEQDNFRDPYVFEDAGTFYMLISARANVGGIWKGVIASYKSTDLLSWNYNGILYHGDSNNYFMMETAQIFKLGATYYLVFSDIGSRRVNYRKSSSLAGPWVLPTGSEFLDGNNFYAAKVVSNGTKSYIMGFTSQQEGNVDSGNKIWGGNLVVHELIQNSNNDLELAMPSSFSTSTQIGVDIKVNRTTGTTEKISNEDESYQLISTSSNISNVIFEPIDAPRYIIATTVSYTDSSKDFGFFLGACDANDNVFSLRFVPSEHKIRLDKTKRSLLTTNTVSDNEVFMNLKPNTDYNVKIVIENSIVVIYVDDKVALSSRVYKASNTSWAIFADNSKATFKNIKVTKP